MLLFILSLKSKWNMKKIQEDYLLKYSNELKIIVILSLFKSIKRKYNNLLILIDETKYIKLLSYSSFSDI